MSEYTRLAIWGLFIVYDLYVFLDYEMNRKETHGKKRKKNRKATSYRRRTNHFAGVWNDLDHLNDYR